MRKPAHTDVALKPTVENVLPFYLRKAKAGQRVCLVTLYNVDTVSPRPLGSQIAVSEDGESFGFITGGCAEAAIVHEALMALKENRSRRIRIGSESPWFDIKLPCGAGIDLHFSIADSTQAIGFACEQLADRKPVALQIDVENDGIEVFEPSGETRPKHFVRNYLPTMRLAIFGSGPYLNSLESIAAGSECEVVCWSPDYEAQHESDCNTHQPLRPNSIPEVELDAWTAAVLLFHEHDWEPKLLQAILKSDGFYVGALGSRKTHSNRLARLREMRVCESDLRRIHGPVGLSIGAKTPGEIALSIMSEIVAEFRKGPHERT